MPNDGPSETKGKIKQKEDLTTVLLRLIESWPTAGIDASGSLSLIEGSKFLVQQRQLRKTLTKEVVR